VTEDAAYSFFAQPGFDYYMVVDSYSGASGSYRYRFEFGVAALGELCLQNVPESLVDAPVMIGPGESIFLDGTLERKQGHYDHAQLECSAPGHEHIIPVTLTAPGTLSAEITSWDGADPAVLGLTQGCSANLELNCGVGFPLGEGALVTGAFNTPIDTYLVVDQSGVSGGNYQLSISVN
jgi:hypothetical protein